MIITNRFQLPEPIVNAMRADRYSAGDSDYTVTQLINPVRITLLTKRHWDEIEEDASERLWVLLGQAVHAILESSGADNALQEERIGTTIHGLRISGSADLYHGDGTIQDFKVTSSWSVVFGSRLDSWEKQLNSYAHLFRTAGFSVTRLQAVCLFRDWSETQSRKSADYPRHPVVTVAVPAWNPERAEQFLDEAVQTLIQSQSLPDDLLPQCTPADMWERATTWAVMKGDRKSAVKICDTPAQAMALVERGAGTHVEVRWGRRVRCENYCPVRKWCSQYRTYLSDTRRPRGIPERSEGSQEET
jgi:hypothetical protein